ncbi:RNA polymerase sigma factor [Candidatus Curtissbacteria bacterium]|nr:RNA polymerase sigma factor [Candidatus Curtissbacteria bacterium]
MDEVEGLVRRAKKGERDAYGKIYEIFLPKIFRFVYYLAGKREQAEDICQETFLKAWKALSTFSESRGTFQAYLFKIARNLVIDWQRKKKEQPFVAGFDAPSHEDLSEDLQTKEREAMVWKLLEGLEPVEKQILVLRYFEDFSTGEVARVMKMKEGALRVRIHRIMAKCRIELEI